MGPGGVPRKISDTTRLGPKTGKDSRGSEPKTIQEVEREALLVLLELFGVVDYVFSEPDAFMEPRRKLRMVYESWKEIRTKLDPDFNAHRYTREKYQ